MIAAAATIAVVYPHMNGIGGDRFWLIKRKAETPIGISGCGRAAILATVDWHAERGHRETIPTRGGLAALTVPGTVDGWRLALDLVPEKRRMPLRDLLANAIAYAGDGIAVTGNQCRVTRDKLDTLADVAGFAATFLVDVIPPEPGHRQYQEALAGTLQAIADHGTDTFYRSHIADEHARFLAAHDSPIRIGDFRQFEAETVKPLAVRTSDGVIYNMVPPTQGVSSLMILAIFDRLGVDRSEGFEHLHGLVGVTKQAFIIRNGDWAIPTLCANRRKTGFPRQS